MQTLLAAIRAAPEDADAVLLVALSGGAANLVDCTTGDARKLDEHGGQPVRRWIFIHDGRILVAG